jgi:hypothetical protein
MSFQKITIIVSLSILVIMLLLVAYMMYRSQSTATWPPIVSECPDYFEVVGPQVCNNVRSLGSCHGIISFTDPGFQGSSGLKQKKAWAQNCGVVWDGITNNTSL